MSSQSPSSGTPPTPATPGHDETGLPPGYPYRPAWELTPRQVKALRDAGTPFVFIDCRTPQEFEIASIDGAVLIPLHEAGTRLEELKQHLDSKIVIHCHHGQRSLQMTAFLRHQGFKEVHSMAGGIDVWSMDVDPAVTRY